MKAALMLLLAATSTRASGGAMEQLSYAERDGRALFGTCVECAKVRSGAAFGQRQDGRGMVLARGDYRFESPRLDAPGGERGAPRTQEPPAPKAGAAQPKGVPKSLLYGAGALVGGVQGFFSRSAAGVLGGWAGAAIGAAGGLAAAYFFSKGDYGAAAGVTAGSIVGAFLGGPVAAAAGALIGGVLGHLVGKLFF